MALKDLVDQLHALGFDVQTRDNDKLYFPFTIDTGRFAGTQIQLGFVGPPDFPLTPPSGPHISPPLLPLNAQQGPHPSHGIHASPFGSGWQYWSRPLNHWAQTKRTAGDVLRHVRHLFDTQ